MYLLLFSSHHTFKTQSADLFHTKNNKGGIVARVSDGLVFAHQATQGGTPRTHGRVCTVSIVYACIQGAM